MRFFSIGLDQLWVKGLLVVILLALIAAGKETRRGAIYALISWPIANGVTDLFKHLLPTLRPCNDPAMVPESFLRIGATLSAGTASAHSANMMAVATAFLLTLRGFGVSWLILAILVGISRIYNGVHYPWQVALGWAIGALAASTAVFIGRRMEAQWLRRRAPGLPDDAQKRVTEPQSSGLA